jgi:CheY-like chemotaxis protein
MARTDSPREETSLPGRAPSSARQRVGGFGGAALFRGPPRVLLAEADPFLRRRLVTALVDEIECIEVMEVVDGAHLFRVLRAMFVHRVCEPADLILAPVALHGCDGRAVLAVVRSLGRPTAVVLVGSADDLGARDLGAAAALLLAPCDAAAVSSLVRDLASRPAEVVTYG